VTLDHNRRAFGGITGGKKIEEKKPLTGGSTPKM